MGTAQTITTINELAPPAVSQSMIAELPKVQ